MQKDYDETNPISIEKFAKRIIGMSLKEILSESDLEEIQSNFYNKGEMGQLLEQYYFGYKPNSKSQPDFPKAGLELKSTPMIKRSNGDLSAKERLVLNIINYEVEADLGWEKSTVWRKNRRLLLMFYVYVKGIPIIELLYKLVGIWDYPEEDLLIIKHDYETIVQKIKDGKAHEISEGDTIYLAACRKGQGNINDIREQPNSDIRALQRAFSLKQKYINNIITKWTRASELDEIEPILKSASELKNTTFEDLIIHKFLPYLGKNVEEISKLVDLNIERNAKNYYSTLSLRILGIKKKKVEEFEKADIVMKTIRVDLKNKPKEDISFPYFKYKELAGETWDTSTLRYMLEKRFFCCF